MVVEHKAGSGQILLQNAFENIWTANQKNIYICGLHMKQKLSKACKFKAMQAGKPMPQKAKAYKSKNQKPMKLAR